MKGANLPKRLVASASAGKSLGPGLARPLGSIRGAGQMSKAGTSRSCTTRPAPFENQGPESEPKAKLHSSKWCGIGHPPLRASHGQASNVTPFSRATVLDPLND